MPSTLRRSNCSACLQSLTPSPGSRSASEHAQLESKDRAKKLKTLDAAFVVDCTSSMRGVLSNAKEKMKCIEEAVSQRLGVGACVRFAIVAYRDYEDTKHMQVLPFTSDLQRIQDFMCKLEACTNSRLPWDICEDVIGGLQEALALSWDAKTRILYLVCDAPPHGHRFYEKNDKNKRWDSFPADIKQWRPTDTAIEQSIKLRISMVGLNYGQDKCEKMFQVFKDLCAAAGSFTKRIR